MRYLKAVALILAIATVISIPASVTAERSVSDYFAELEMPHPYDAFESTPQMGLYRVDGLECVYERNAERIIAPASLTKLVTASVVVWSLSPDTVLTVGSELDMVRPGSSVCGLKKGMRLSVYDLMCGLLMRSGNDAAYTLAVNVARHDSGEELSDSDAVEYFCGMMNDFVDGLGLKNSRFYSPDGYDTYGQHTTVADLAVIAAYVTEVDAIFEITSRSMIRSPIEGDESPIWHNTNFFMHPDFPLYEESVFGMKTGSTGDAGKCLITLYRENGVDYLCIVTGCDSEGGRYVSSRVLMMLNSFSEDFGAITYGMLGLIG